VKSKTKRSSNVLPRHPWLFALPGATLPAEVVCNGVTYRLVETFKHDFFAATGLYQGSAGQVVLKMGRTNELFSIPMLWIGRFLTQREVRLYRRAEDLPGVPKFVGTVGEAGFLHEFVPGHPLQRREAVSDTFFDELYAMLRELHRRGIAYVDLNKRQNVLVGDDGKPYLIDFQISLDLPPTGWRRFGPVQWFLRRFQNADIYHFLKHKRRLRPDLLDEDEARTVNELSPWIRVHRSVARPLTQLRRRWLRRVRGSDPVDVAGATAK
jgi:hypothetical protein